MTPFNALVVTVTTAAAALRGEYVVALADAKPPAGAV